MDVRPDQGDVVVVRFSLDTLVQRIAPGEKDLKKAEPMQVTEMAFSDRVLVSLVPGTNEARRIVVMRAADIEKKRQAERQDWLRRGVFGVVTSVKGNEIALRTRSSQGDVNSTVGTTDRTVFRRYAPGSVRFSDAVLSSLSEIRTGDQLRGRGQKSPDGLRLEAEEVVFGTFVTLAGKVTAVDAGASAVTVKNLETNKLLVVKLTVDSQIKRMPSLPALMIGARTGRAPAAGPSPWGTGPGPTGPGGRAATVTEASAGGPFDFSQILERMPAGTLADLKEGETVVFSSAGGPSSGQVTAIMLVANAEMLLQMATRQSGGSRPSDSGMLNGAGGIFGGLAGLDMSAMIP